ncbi:MAG: tRNA pseudouridine(38-40) synthase TruA [Ignavibacterium sp.]|nr:tRNA pseudouridine(38-40) synthase TruA [Ignavibacterium sp.]MCX7612234.1 tRNA pseudouridine(38-40) synthase TruA [Ignavibacterium sp.]MDW8374323.1 tRNA pseudouridine(38-40) synthase TruA [Ignavibacteriales bacterium]
MFNYLLSIQYDGTNYHGWQSQISGRTIQQEIEKAIFTIIKTNVKIIGAGRTDSGVHALDQKANFRVLEQIDLYKFKFSLNSILPKDISIKTIVEVPENFHARFDAKSRTYIYLISRAKSPFYNRYSFYYPKEINIFTLNELSEKLIGEKDFSAFCKKSVEYENKICKVTKVRWFQKNELIIFRITANRFLRGMVRAIVGTLLFCEKNKLSNDDFEKILLQKDRQFAGENVPANGLFLYKVEY